MTWFISITASVLAGLVGLLLASFIANACVSWYRISSFEGQSGYYVIFIALGGGVAGLILGLITSRFIAAHFGPGFLKEFGGALGVVLVLAGVVALLCRWLADVPPTIDGKRLNLEVEFRFPATHSTKLPTAEGKWAFTLGSLSGQTQRASQTGKVKTDAARLEDGRWIVPAEVFLFTERGRCTIMLQSGDKDIAGFLVSLPAHPGQSSEQWSDWLPRQLANGQSWPADKVSYRFRVARELPPPPTPDPAAIEAQAFAALKPDAPLQDWLGYLQYETPPERVWAIMKVVTARQNEFVQLLKSTNAHSRELAFNAVQSLPEITPEIGEIVRAEGEAIAEQVEKFNQRKADEPSYYEDRLRLCGRFTTWKFAWWASFRPLGWECAPPVRKIYDLARAHVQESGLADIVVNARAILDAVEPAAVSNP